MPPSALAAPVVAATLGAIGGGLAPLLLSRLRDPEPDPAAHAPAEPDADPPPTYADLSRTPRLVAGCAVATGLCAGLLGWRIGWEPGLPTWVFLSVVGVLLAYVDWRTYLLPTAIIAPSYAVVVVLLLIAAASSGSWDAAVRSLAGWAGAGGLFLVLWLIHPRGLGYGDVRLSGLLGMALGWLGWAELVTGVYAGFVLGALGGGGLALAKVFDRKRYPFGPFMLLGALTGVLWGPELAGWYSGF